VSMVVTGVMESANCDGKGAPGGAEARLDTAFTVTGSFAMIGSHVGAGRIRYAAESHLRHLQWAL
jgi:hypothetical protein